MNISLILSRLGISPNLSQDIMLFLTLVFVSFLFGMFIGRYKLITVLINIYATLAIISVIPEKYALNYSNKLLIFFALLILFTLVGKRFFDIYISGSGSGFLWRVFVMSFLEVVLLISISLSLVPEKIGLQYVSPKAYELFASEIARLGWMVAPLVLMFFIHKRINR